MSNQLPKVKFRTNIPVEMTLPYGDGREMPSKFEGQQQYLYTVEIDGAGHALFASEKLHEQLARVGKGGVAKVTKAEKEGQNGNTYNEFEVEVLQQGQPVQQQRAAGATQSSSAGSGGASTPPGSRTGADERLAVLSAAYGACLDHAKGIWLAAGVKHDAGPLHSVASTLFINLQREGYDLSAFLGAFGEKEGTRRLRHAIERAKTEPHLADVRDHFGEQLDRIPSNEAAKRTLYAQLAEAIKSLDGIAAAETPADEPDEEEPRAEQPAAQAPASEGGEVLTLQQTEQIDELASDVFGGKAANLLPKMIAGVTRREDANVMDLTEQEATVLIRTLEARKARLEPA